MKNRGMILKQISLLSQMGLSLVVPLLICIFLCNYLVTRFDFPAFIYIPGFFFGLGGSAASAWKIYAGIMKDTEKDTKKNKTKRGTSFNIHE